MSLYVFKLPDVGEGTAEAEIVAWHVGVGEMVEEDSPLVDVMTDKATVEITSPVRGRVLSLAGAPGEIAVVGASLVELETEAEADDAKGLLIAAIEDDDPVIFLEPKRIYNGPFDGWHDRPVQAWAKHPKSQTPDGYYTVPLGKAEVVREGRDLTVLAYGTMVHVALAGAEAAQVDAEVIDLRTLLPVDIDAITTSVNKTGRCVILHEATRTSGFGAELSALVQENCFYRLEAPIERVAGWDTPYPHAFEWEYFPGPERVARAMRKVMEG